MLEFYWLQDKATLLWEDTKIIHLLSEKNVTWEKFQEKLKSRYLIERYYDDISNEFHDLRLGQLTIDEFVTIYKITSLCALHQGRRGQSTMISEFSTYHLQRKN